MNRAMFRFTRASTALVPFLALAAASCGVDDVTAVDPGAPGAPGDPAAIHPEPGPTGPIGAANLTRTDTSSDRRGIGALAIAVPRAVPLTAVDLRRSLAVTDQVITSTFTLQAVLDQLAAQSGVAGMTGLQLFTQLWDTQNPAASGVTSGPHCDDNGGTVNGFTYACRPVEGQQALTPATSITQYSLVGLFNRFDLASPSGADCGEHRMVFGKTTGGGRSFIIFEAVLPNPTPVLGLE